MRPWLGARGAGLAAAASAALFALAQPPAGLWPLAPVCLAPLCAALAGRGPLARARVGALAGALAALAIAIGPASIGAAAFSERPLWQGGLLTGAIGLGFGACGFATFALLAGDPRRAAVPLAALRTGLAFAAGEAVRAHLFGGLPWLLLAYALAPAPQLLGLAAWAGVPALSCWLGASAGAALRAACGPGRRAAALSLLALAALALLAAPSSAPVGAPGTVVPARGAAPAAPAVRIALVQPALPMERWSDSLQASATVAHLTALSRRAAEGRRFALLIWPENAVQALLPANEALVRGALTVLDGGAEHLLLGAPRYDPAAPSRRFNSALLFRADGERIAVHDKVRLLPLFETSPGGLRALSVSGADLTPGDEPAVLPAGDALRLGPLLCYEVLFPALGRRQVRDGAGVLVNLSNDAWFAGGGGAEQHFAAAVVLAATLERPLLRATPTGVTGAIDARGRVVARLAADEPGVLVVDVVPGEGLSPAARLGATPEWLAALLAVAWTAVRRARSRAPCVRSRSEMPRA